MTEQQLEDVIRNWSTYCTEENFIGIGSTRKAYRAGDVVIKVHLHPLGHVQSDNETNIYRAMKEKGLDPLFAAVYYLKDFPIAFRIRDDKRGRQYPFSYHHSDFLNEEAEIHSRRSFNES